MQVGGDMDEGWLVGRKTKTPFYDRSPLLLYLYPPPFPLHSYHLGKVIVGLCRDSWPRMKRKGKEGEW